MQKFMFKGSELALNFEKKISFNGKNSKKRFWTMILVK